MKPVPQNSLRLDLENNSNQLFKLIKEITMISRNGVLVLACLLIIGCDGSEPDKSNLAPIENQLSTTLENLDNTVWTTGCTEHGIVTGGIVLSFDPVIEEMKFKGTEMTFSYISYNGKTSEINNLCQTEDFRIMFVYDYNITDDLGQQIKDYTSAKKLDLTLKKIEVFPTTAAGLKYFEREFYYLKDFDLQVGKAFDILNNDVPIRTTGLLDSTPLSGSFGGGFENPIERLRNGIKIYQIIGLDNLVNNESILYIGNYKYSTGTYTEETRPTQLMQIGLRKQKL
jgi:hypothetical protein